MSNPVTRGLTLAGLVLLPLLAWWLWPQAPAEAPPPPPVAMTAPLPAPVAAPAPAAPVEPATPPVDQRWRVLGTMVNGSDPRASMATVSIDGSPPRLMRVGEGLGDEQVLLAVEPHGVRVGRRDGSAAVRLPVVPLAAAPLAARPPAPEVEASPIVPPHAGMEAPPPHEAGTPGSLLEQRRRGASAP